MQFNLFRWLFEDPYTAASGTNIEGGVEPFRFFWPWIIFCGIGLLICFYYWVEGRKRFVKSRALLKYMLDRYLGWFAVICFVGIPIALARIALDQYFFAWRVWRYAWLVSLIAWAVIWLVYMVRKFPRERSEYAAWQNREQYIKRPGGKRKAKAATR